MAETKTLMLTCSCEKRRKFPYVLRVIEDNSTEEISSIQLDCPFGAEDYCDKHLSIDLPPGMHPEKDQEVLRE